MTGRKTEEEKRAAAKKRAEQDKPEYNTEKRSYSAHTHPRKVEFFISLAAIKKLRKIVDEGPKEQKIGGR
ncbi:MAG: hypothetical protein HPY50_18070 [Firmicutes bacterium]|nr:hypothetical protein [Bacillota bacterium]